MTMNNPRGVKARPPKPQPLKPQSALAKVREKLNEEIKAALVMKEAYANDDFFTGRLNGLLWVRDHLLFNMKED